MSLPPKNRVKLFKYPFLLVFLTGALFIIGIELSSIWACLLAFLFVALSFYTSIKIGFVVLLSTVVLSLIHYADYTKRLEIQEVLNTPRTVQVKGTVSKLLRGHRKIVQLDDSFHQAKVIWSGEASIGDRLEGELRIRKANLPRNPGTFNEAQWLRSMGVDAFAYGKLKKIGYSHIYHPLRGLLILREKIKNRLSVGIDNEQDRKVIHSMFLGERYGNNDPIMEDYRLSGTMHVFAVSGMHVMMIGTLGLLVLRFFNLPNAIAIPLTVILMLVYAGVTGFGTPAVRAVIMAAVFLSSYLFTRKPVLINSMALSAVIVLLLDTNQIFTVGFQLSYAVLLAIVLTARWWGDRLAWIAQVDPFLPKTLYTKAQRMWLKMRHSFAEGTAVSIAAWTGSVAFIFHYFKLISPVALLLGVPMVFSLFCVMCVSCASLLFGSVHDVIASGINQLNAKVAMVSRSMAAEAAEIPWGHSSFIDKDEKGFVILDVKGGGAVYLNFGGGVLIDAGGKKDAQMITQAVQMYGGNLDSCILSHGDSKHCGGLIEVASKLGLKQVIHTEKPSSSHVEKKALTWAKNNQIRCIRAEEGQVYTLEEGVSIQVLYDGSQYEGASADDRGLVLMLHWQGKRILFLNDAGFYTEKKLLEDEVSLKSDLLVIGKHSEESEFHEDFYKAVDPRIIVATNFHYNYREMRNYHWVQKASEYCHELYLQNLTGAVSVTHDNGQLVCETMLTLDK